MGNLVGEVGSICSRHRALAFWCEGKTKLSRGKSGPWQVTSSEKAGKRIPEAKRGSVCPQNWLNAAVVEICRPKKWIFMTSWLWASHSTQISFSYLWTGGNDTTSQGFFQDIRKRREIIKTMVCWETESPPKKKKPWYVAIPNFYGVNINTVDDFRLLMASSLAGQFSESVTIGSSEPAGSRIHGYHSVGVWYALAGFRTVFISSSQLPIQGVIMNPSLWTRKMRF